MGGGDLNLKKSWHPLTMQNLERVWKAEQRHEAEQKRIEELQAEIRQERSREEMKKMAVDAGITKAKAERVDWLYSGHASMVNREEYLLGKKIDKMVDPLLMESEREKQALESGAGALFAGTDNANSTADLAAKIREDPLFMMRKKEEEAKKRLLDNPVKLKQLKEILSKKKHKSSKKRKSHHHDSDSDSEPHHHSRHAASHKDDRRGHSDHHDHDHRRHQRRDRSRSPVSSYHGRERSRRDDGRERLEERRERHDGERSAFSSGRHTTREGRGPSSITRRMDSAELERRRKEMMETAREKDRERESRVRRHRREAEMEQTEIVSEKERTFLQPLKVKSLTSSHSLEDRIHRNIYSVQRTKSALTSEGFLKR